MAKPTGKDLHYYSTLLSAFRLKKHGLSYMKIYALAKLGDEAKMGELIDIDVAEYGTKRHKAFFESDMNKERMANIKEHFMSKTALLNELSDMCANDLKEYMSSHPDEATFVGQFLDVVATVNAAKRVVVSQRKIGEKNKRDDDIYDVLDKYHVSEDDMSKLMSIISVAISSAAPEFVAEE